LVLAVLALFSIAIIGLETRPKSPLSSRLVTEELLSGARDFRAGWLSHGRDWSNQRYAPFTEINR
jgi:hypothetical protein